MKLSSRSKSAKTQGFILPMMVVAVIFMTVAVVALIVALQSVRSGQLSLLRKSIREYDSIVVADSIRESVYDYSELAPAASTLSFADNLEERLDLLDTGDVNFSVTSIESTLSVPPVLRDNIFPVGSIAMAPSGFSTASAAVQDRRAFSIIKDGMRFSSLASGEITVGVDYADTSRSDFSWTFAVDAIGLPISNFSIIAYGLPSSGTIPTGGPTDFDGSGVIEATRAAGGRVHMLNLKTNLTTDNSFPDVYADDNTLPYYYRPHVSLIWNTFEYGVGLINQGILYSNAQFAGTVFEFSNPTATPTGMTYDSGSNTVTIDAGSFSAGNPIVVLDYVGGGTVRLVGGGIGQAPLNVVIRNFTSPYNPTLVELTSPRKTVFYGIGCRITESIDSTIGGENVGVILLDDRSQIDAAMSLQGTLAFDMRSEPITNSALSSFSVTPFAGTNLADFDNRVPVALITSVEKQ